MWVRSAARTARGLSLTTRPSKSFTRFHLGARNSDLPCQTPRTEHIGCTIRPIKSDETLQHVRLLVLSLQPPPNCTSSVSLYVHQEVHGATSIAKRNQDCKKSAREIRWFCRLLERRASSVSISAALSVTFCNLSLSRTAQNSKSKTPSRHVWLMTIER